MIKNFPQFVPQEVCLSCDGCCRFTEPESPWRPKIAQEEIEGKDSSEGIFSKDLDRDHYIKTQEHQEQFRCTFFHASDHICHVYQCRPFECRLYPFLLTQKEGFPAVSVHLSCPYVQEQLNSDGFKDQVEELKKYFRQSNVLAFIQRNPSLLGEYPQSEQEIEYLFTLAP